MGNKMMNKQTLISLMGLSVGSVAYAGGLNSSDNAPVEPAVETTVETTVETAVEPAVGPVLVSPVEPVTETVPEPTIEPILELTSECQTWMDKNPDLVQKIYCVDQPKTSLAKVELVCGTESMNYLLDRIPGDASVNPLKNFNNYARAEIDFATFDGFAYKGFFPDEADNVVCEYNAPSAEDLDAEPIAENQAPLVELLAGGFAQEYNSGRSNNYIFKVTDPENDDWTVEATIQKNESGIKFNLTPTLGDEQHVLVPVKVIDYGVGEYQVCLTATDVNGAESETVCSDYTINPTAVAALPDELPVPTLKPQTIDFKVGYSAMFQPAFNQQSHGLQTSVAIPTNNGLKLVPGLRYGVLMGGDTPDTTSSNSGPVTRSGSEYLESMPNPQDPNSEVDLQFRWTETENRYTETRYSAPSNGHDLQAQLYLQFPDASTKLRTVDLSAALQAGVYLGRTWGQELDSQTLIRKELTATEESWLVDENGNEQLWQSANPVEDTQSTFTDSTESVDGAFYGGVGARVYTDATLENGLGVYTNLDAGIRMNQNGASLDVGFGAGLVYKF
jgi:hypothetical protein